MMYDYRMEEIMKKRCIKYFRKKGKNGGYQFDEKKIAKKETIENILSELLKDEGGPAIIYFPVSENSIFFGYGFLKETERIDMEVLFFLIEEISESEKKEIMTDFSTKLKEWMGELQSKQGENPVWIENEYCFPWEDYGDGVIYWMLHKEYALVFYGREEKMDIEFMLQFYKNLPVDIMGRGFLSNPYNLMKKRQTVSGKIKVFYVTEEKIKSLESLEANNYIFLSIDGKSQFWDEFSQKLQLEKQEYSYYYRVMSELIQNERIEQYNQFLMGDKIKEQFPQFFEQWENRHSLSEKERISLEECMLLLFIAGAECYWERNVYLPTQEEKERIINFIGDFYESINSKGTISRD